MASTLASTLQQMSMSFGVATASLVAALFIPDRDHASAERLIRGIHQAFLVLGGLTLLSSALRSGYGQSISQTRGQTRGTNAGHRRTLPPHG